MSTALAIASVTHVLKDLLNDALVNAVTDATGSNVLISTLPPDRVNGESGTPSTRLNLFLHQVTVNAAWRNTELPVRDDRGRIVNNPLLPLNLHYLLTAYGEAELHAEILLGYAMLVLHENAILGRDRIRTSLSNGAIDGSLLPPAYRAIATSELADQVELIKIAPQPFGTEEMSKLWTSLQTHYRPSAAYEVSVVLMERRFAKRNTLPVLTRGEPDAVLGRDRGVVVQPSMRSPFPSLEAIVFPDPRTVALADDIIALEGYNLAGTPVVVRFNEPKSQFTVDVTPEANGTPTRLKVKVGGPAWRAGIYQVTVLVTKGNSVTTTNALAMMLAPDFSHVTTKPANVHPNQTATFKLTCNPSVAKTQHVSLIVGTREILAEPLTTPTAHTLRFKERGFSKGETFPLRLRVDGAESVLIDRTKTPPEFYADKSVTIA